MFDRIIEKKLKTIDPKYNWCKNMDDQSKKFIIKALRDDTEYIQTHYPSIKTKDQEIKECCFRVIVSFTSNIDLIPLLIKEFMIDIKQTDNDDNTYFMHACAHNVNLNVIAYLAKKIDPLQTNNQNTNCLMYACAYNNLNIIKYLIDDIKINTMQTNDDGVSCLAYACLTNPNLDIIIYLIEYQNLNPGDTDNMGSNCLMFACLQNDNINVIKYLIEQKIDVNEVNEDELNCLMFACISNSNIEIIKYLINEQKMDINKQNSNKLTCCMCCAIFNENYEIAKYLINDLKIDINYVDDHNNPYLDYACWQNRDCDLIKYMFNELKMDQNILMQGKTCYLRACQNSVNDNYEVIKYLFEDINYNEDFSTNDIELCLENACGYLTNLDSIKYLIARILYAPRDSRSHLLDGSNMNKNFMSACKNNRNVDVLKYLITEFEIDLSYVHDGYSFLAMACENNTCIDVIKYLIEDLAMNPYFLLNPQNENESCLSLAFRKNRNHKIIKYLIETINLDPNHENKFKNTCLEVGCKKNTCLKNIKYLIEKIEQNPHKIKKSKPYLITTSCQNKNLNIIKYFIEYGIDHNILDKNKNNCLILACWKNTNLNVIKYFVNQLHMDIWAEDTRGMSCFLLVCEKNKNKNILKYLIKEHNVLKKIEYLNNSETNKIIPLIINDQSKLLDLFILNPLMNCENNILQLLKNINPLILPNILYTCIDIIDPFKCSFSDFMKLLNDLHCILPLSDKFVFESHSKYHTNDINDKNMIEVYIDDDYTEQQQLLFTHKKIPYYGKKRIVFDSIHALNHNDFISQLVQDHGQYHEIEIDQSLDVPKYIMNMYIQSCYTHKIDIDKINHDDIYNFIKLIDQYPTKYISIGQLELKLMKYIDTEILSKPLSIEYMAHFFDFFKSIAERYGLRLMCIMLHNLTQK